MQIAARRIIEHNRETLPDLTRTVVLVPDADIAPELRRALLHHADGHSALLGPDILPLQTWVQQSARAPAALGAAACELMFVDSIRGHTRLFGDNNPWRISESLMALFDELTLNHVVLPDEQDSFVTSLQRAYGMRKLSLTGLSREAQVVHTLWHAWHQQLQADELLEPAAAYVLQLETILRQRPCGEFAFLLGHHDLAVSESRWFREMAAQNRVAWLAHDGLQASVPVSSSPPGSPPEQMTSAATTSAPRGDAGKFLDAVFSGPAPDMATRARAVAAEIPASPLTGYINILAANDAEREARAVDLQVRRWLLADDAASVGIVTEDRRLARRVRALLEHAGIDLQDNSGWALSTTSAAAALERWLETVEENFAWQPLLDVLKSPFVFPEQATESRLETVYRLEQDVILHEQVTRGLDRYRRHIDYRSKRLPWPSADTPARMHDLLNHLERAAEPLRSLLRGSHPARLCLANLRESMERLGMWSLLDADPAGQRVVQIWETLDAGSRICPLKLGWLEFRSWLGHALERHNFRPVRRPAQVQLLTLSRSRLHRFDAVVVAGCDRTHLPGQVAANPWFNDSVRRELGLPGREETLRSRLHDFRCLLESARSVLLTWRREDLGEPVLPGPWLELLTGFHELAYGATLDARDLEQMLDQPGSRVASAFPRPLPAPVDSPRPTVSAALRPTTLSASAYQQLVDCPYQFYTARCLKLQAPDVVREALQKSDYGERVHRCLQAFHGNVDYLPGPFPERITTDNHARAIQMLEEISRAVFARDLEDNFEHRGWLKRWLARIPDYIDWQRRREETWTVAAVEQSAQRDVGETLALKGRLDRVDQRGDQLAVVDYKTGGAARQADIETGEDVQLAVYAALTNRLPSRAEYLLLDSTPVKSGALLKDDALARLYRLNLDRLEKTVGAIDGGAELPAWGDEKTCNHCPMDGLCRKQAWLNG